MGHPDGNILTGHRPTLPVTNSPFLLIAALLASRGPPQHVAHTSEAYEEFRNAHS